MKNKHKKSPKFGTKTSAAIMLGTAATGMAAGNMASAAETSKYENDAANELQERLNANEQRSSVIEVTGGGEKPYEGGYMDINGEDDTLLGGKERWQPPKETVEPKQTWGEWFKSGISGAASELKNTAKSLWQNKGSLEGLKQTAKEHTGATVAIGAVAAAAIGGIAYLIYKLCKRSSTTVNLGNKDTVKQDDSTTAKGSSDANTKI